MKGADIDIVLSAIRAGRKRGNWQKCGECSLPLADWEISAYL
jgi:hypothetical protein